MRITTALLCLICPIWPSVTLSLNPVIRLGCRLSALRYPELKRGMAKKNTDPIASVPIATSPEVRPSARFNRPASGDPGSNGGEIAWSPPRRISSATNVETASTRNIARAIRKVVSTVRIAEAIMQVTASMARNAKSRLVRAENNRTNVANNIKWIAESSAAYSVGFGAPTERFREITQRSNGKNKK